jgi:hypothetical protein
MATSAAKLIANRTNATLSTGPVDTSKTRFNGLTHGLTSKKSVIPGENQEEYDTFEANLRKQLAPATPIENVLAERVIAAAWRLQRFARVETAFFTSRIDAYLEANPNSDPDVAMANLFVDPAESARMRLFLRYQNSVQREYDKAYKEFKAAQAERPETQSDGLSRLLAAYAMDTDEEDTSLTNSALAPKVGFASQEPQSARQTAQAVAA